MDCKGLLPPGESPTLGPGRQVERSLKGLQVLLVIGSFEQDGNLRSLKHVVFLRIGYNNL